MSQPHLKPQDLVLLVRIATSATSAFKYGALAAQSGLAQSQVHASIKFLILAKLLSGNTKEGLFANKSKLIELIVHGVPFFFPPVVGGPARGLATGVSQLDSANMLSRTVDSEYVWPDAIGSDRGIALSPIHGSVITVARKEIAVHKVFSAIDTLRVGAAREREIAIRNIRVLLA